VDSRTRRRLSGFLATGIVLAALATAGHAGLMIQTGTYALLGGSPKVVSQFWAQRRGPFVQMLNVRQMQLGSTKPVLAYDVDMERLMHLIVIRDDFESFAHLHPAYNASNGTFSVAFMQEPNHRYFVYADTDPTGIGQQVFRFTLENNGPMPRSKPLVIPQTGPDVKAGPYTVILAKSNLPARTPLRLDLTVVKGDDPAEGLTPYLGAAAHVVIINTDTLAYVHVHPTLRGQSHSMSMSDMASMAKAGPFMELDLPALPAGTYRAWVQFKASAPTPYVAAFTLNVR